MGLALNEPKWIVHSYPLKHYLRAYTTSKTQLCIWHAQQPMEDQLSMKNALEFVLISLLSQFKHMYTPRSCGKQDVVDREFVKQCATRWHKITEGMCTLGASILHLIIASIYYRLQKRKPLLPVCGPANVACTLIHRFELEGLLAAGSQSRHMPDTWEWKPRSKWKSTIKPIGIVCPRLVQKN